MDAAHTKLPSHSIDFHFSVTVLEHIPPAILTDIFNEAKRILKPTGRAIHIVDLSDHFQHQDTSITQINFLRFTEQQWQHWAGNEYAYCNRLRGSDYLSLLTNTGFQVLKAEKIVDEASVLALQNGFKVDENFSQYDIEDLAIRTLKLLLRPTEDSIKNLPK
jgi:SAM-dependent methyltransferase